MNKQELAQLKAISGQDSYLYQLAKENSLDGLKTDESYIVDGSKPYGNDKMERLEYMEETMQERADEFRKDDSMPEPDFLEGVQVCKITDPSCDACQ